MRGFEYSKGRVNRAGETVRDAIVGPPDHVGDPAELRAAVGVCREFRAAHARPLVTANMGLRSCMTTLGCERGIVTQRLKRWPTIVDKLVRFPDMELARMQDIGGCRAVLDTMDDVKALRERFMANSHRRNGNEDRERNYVATPQPSGYRAVHIHTSYHGYRIEVQLRTPLQHTWAIMVEMAGSRMGHDLKSGRGPQPVLDLLAKASEGMELEELGVTPDSTFLEEFGNLRTAASEWF